MPEPAESAHSLDAQAPRHSGHGARDWGYFDGWYRDCLRASCEAVYPENAFGAPDWRDTDLEVRMLAYVDGLPPDQRRLLKLMFIGVEFVSLLLAPLRRFSRRSRSQRTAAITRWRGTSVLPLRLLGDALKSSLHMVYLSHPAVVRYMGEYKVWAHPDDKFEVEVRGAAELEAM